MQGKVGLQSDSHFQTSFVRLSRTLSNGAVVWSGRLVGKAPRDPTTA
jgi:hypothetical protein